MKIIPFTLNQINDFIEKHHRHHKPVQGHRFSLGLLDDEGQVIGACSVGRPVSRGCDPWFTAEVTRLVTDGSKNACSKLYSASARICKEMGFNKIQTYILDSEPGTSLKASGWTKEVDTKGGQWTGTNGKPRRQDQPTVPKQRWAKILNND